MITIWDPALFQKHSSFDGNGFLAVTGSWSHPKMLLGIINVYAPQQANQKNQLWISIQNIVLSQNNMAWIVFGDFNEVREERERKGSRFIKSGAIAFNNFIYNSGLLEIRNGGHRYTRISADGQKLSKLDRILVSHKFFELCSNPIVEILPRSYSDHCHILQNSINLDYGPPPSDILTRGSLMVLYLVLLKIVGGTAGPIG